MSRSITTDRKRSSVHKHWSAKDKVRAVAAYLVVGNMAVVEEQTGIPLSTLNYWKSQPWWYEQIERVRQSEDQEIDNTFTQIVKKTQAVILDRIENGDFYVDRDGKIFRKPVNLRDASIVGAISMDKRRDLRAIPVSESGKIGMQERLKNLEAEFTKLVKREETTIDITPQRIEDNGEEGLQAGSGNRDPGTKSGPLTAESSPSGND